MKLNKLKPALAGALMIGLLFPSKIVLASDEYPTHTETSDANGITMTNTVSWNDETHANENYNANLDITINGLKDKKTFNEPIDVQVIHDVSTSMDYICYAENHVSFSYCKDSSNAFTEEQLQELKEEISTYLLDLLTSKEITDKNDWISIAGKQDKDGNVFSDDAYLVPMNSFYMKPDPSMNEGFVLSSDEPETRYWVIDMPEASKDIPQDPDGYPYWNNKYHAGIDEDGNYYSLSQVGEPQYPGYIHYGFFDRRTAILSGCKTYTTTANALMSNFAINLYNANSDNHLSIASFSEDTKYVSDFSSDSKTFDNDLIAAFNSAMGQTNYEAGLVTGRDNLNNHNDTDGRKKYVIFISDGRPNRSLDDAGNIVESSDMDRLREISGAMKDSGIEIYTVGFCIDKWTNDTYLLPMATDEEHSHFRTPDQLDQMVEIYDLIQERVIEDTFIKSTVENTISKYYTVDTTNLPDEVTLIEEEKALDDGTTRTIQKIRYNVKTEDLDSNGINTKTIPLILKEEYRNTNEYYPTNDEELNGANANYENLDATKQNIAVKTPWLSVNTKSEETYEIKTEVVNGTIFENITGIKAGENKKITYSPNEGYVLDYIEVDGEKIDISDFESAYNFENINSNHTIKVVYKAERSEETYEIKTEVINGTITENITGIKAGENKKITYSPNEGYVLDYIEVDGEKIDISDFESAYNFENVNSNHTIKVVYKAESVEDPGKPSTPDNDSNRPGIDNTQKPNQPNNSVQAGGNIKRSSHSVQTGDNTNRTIYIVGLVVSLTGLICIIAKKRKQNHD
ncbi:MAG: VWA domain-containing protein [Lachnospiraceae bacterium]|nr:VWA domain-containing protein [Lachnospiraceae bacterium]